MRLTQPRETRNDGGENSVALSAHFVNVPALTVINCFWISISTTDSVEIHKEPLMVVVFVTWSYIKMKQGH